MFLITIEAFTLQSHPATDTKLSDKLHVKPLSDDGYVPGEPLDDCHAPLGSGQASDLHAINHKQGYIGCATKRIMECGLKSEGSCSLQVAKVALEVEGDLLWDHCIQRGGDWICDDAIACVVRCECESVGMLRGRTNSVHNSSSWQQCRPRLLEQEPQTRVGHKTQQLHVLLL